MKLISKCVDCIMEEYNRDDVINITQFCEDNIYLFMDVSKRTRNERMFVLGSEKAFEDYHRIIFSSPRYLVLPAY